MQKAGKKLVENISELQAAVKVASNVSLAHSAVEEVRRIVTQLVRAARHVQANELHLALAIVNDLRASSDLCAPPPHPFPSAAAPPPLCLLHSVPDVGRLPPTSIMRADAAVAFGPQSESRVSCGEACPALVPSPRFIRTPSFWSTGAAPVVDHGCAASCCLLAGASG